MPDQAIFEAITKALTQIQEWSGRETGEINAATKPIGDLPGFDSHCGLEFNCAVEALLNIQVPLEENLCVNDKLNRANSVAQIAERISEIAKAK